MKRVLVAVIAGCLGLCLTGGALAATTNSAVFQLAGTKYKVNDRVLTMDASPFIANDRVYVPIRYLAQALGVADKDIQWDKGSGVAALTYRSDRTIRISMKAGDRSLTVAGSPGDGGVQQDRFVNNKTIAMDVAPLIKNGRYYLPARWVAEALDYHVRWSGPTQCVLVYSPGDVPPAPFPKVTTRKIESTSATLKITAQIPVISGLQDTAWQKELNRQIMDKFDKAKADMAKNVQDYENYVKSNGRPPIPLELFISYDQVTTGSVLSLAVETYEFTGGAHGMAWKDYYNIDTKNNRLLTLRDLFKENVDYKSIINREINRQIRLSLQNGDGIYFEGDMGFKSVSDNQNYYIDGDNLVVCFGEYEIAPYAAGMPEIKIPLSLLKPNLNENFLSLVTT
ncbi:stalk domain-containing protein [Desulfotruncus alcoholivorax]|uniref:stalk domain-containing protein n=1 Tax=Desulfotruncus alcoholivorax TaxID=265477 RepID=UPI0003F8EE72|nr:stalk domain-containing protein [Desulfotruncus alcoholivorax]